VDFDFTTLLRFLHVLSAFGLIAGILGRNITIGQAGRASEIRGIELLLRLASRFEMLMVRPGSLLVLVLGLGTAWRQGWPIFGTFEGAASNWLLASLGLYVTVILLVPLAFIPRGKRFDAALRDSIKAETITPKLRAALQDNVVRAAHAYEIGAGIAIIYLMVAKPF